MVEAGPLDPESFTPHVAINTANFANFNSTISYRPKNEKTNFTDLVALGHAHKANSATKQDYCRQKMKTDPTTPENQTSAN